MSDRAGYSDSLVSRRMVIAGIAAGAAATAAYALEPRSPRDRAAAWKLDNLIPDTCGPWHYGSSDGLIVARQDDELPRDGYDQLLGRTYQAAGAPSIMLLVAYGSAQGATLQLHRPETCYPGQGFQLSQFSDLDLELGRALPIHARRFTAVRDERVERLVYWTRIANSFPRNTAGEYRAILGSVLRGLVPDGVLVRISTITPDIAEADRAIDAFTAALIAGTSVAGRRILLGDTMASEIGETAAVRRG